MSLTINQDFFCYLLDSFKNPVLFADTGHMVRYANKAAKQFYPAGDKLVGRSLLGCHNQKSQARMIEILQRMEEGLDEVLITDNEKRRIYMRAVRDTSGALLGYYERFEPARRR
ncbi:PAS domain-containing protein [Malonomonas rubra]|uniref:PAS domain-containing protein n=1 Tax=Malonomonas rubra TaxID=57040 RepID=UPI0026F01C4D|nr:PAS domain-containing protein [Malonomonas rubra]